MCLEFGEADSSYMTGMEAKQYTAEYTAVDSPFMLYTVSELCGGDYRVERGSAVTEVTGFC